MCGLRHPRAATRISESDDMPAPRPSEICFFCPETLYQDLVRELATHTGRARRSIERNVSREIELLLTRLVERPVLLAELVSRPSARRARRRSGAEAAAPPRSKGHGGAVEPGAKRVTRSPRKPRARE